MTTVLKSLLNWLAKIHEKGARPTRRPPLAKLWVPCFIGFVSGRLAVTACRAFFSGEALDGSVLAKEALISAIIGTIVPLVMWKMWKQSSHEKEKNQCADPNAPAH